MGGFLPGSIRETGAVSATASYQFEAVLWEWTSRSSWYFYSLPEQLSDEIDERFGAGAAGFGSLRVEVTIGDSTWRTSIFPSNTEKTYVLPVKKAIRTAEGLAPDASAQVELTVLMA